MCQLFPRIRADQKTYCNRLGNSQVGSLRILIFFVLFGATAGVACGQPSTTEIKGKDEISIDFQHPAKLGETKKYLIKLGDIPNAPTISNRYRFLDNKSYYLSTEVIDLGSPTVTFFKVPVINEEEFKKVRVLRLTPEEMMRGGLEWKDCTVSLEMMRTPNSDKSSTEYLDFEREFKAVYAKYLPDYSRRKVACNFDVHKLGQKEYFVLVVQTREPQSKPYTDLKLTLDEERHNPTGNTFTYKVTFKNTGAKDIGELTLRSVFDIDTKLTSVRPKRGECQKSIWGNMHGSTVCYLGILRAGESVSVEFDGEPSGYGGDKTPDKINTGWRIEAVIREQPNDPILMVNYFTFDLFAGR